MIGRTLGRYSIESKLGEGGMGVVYRAHDATLDRDVALKVLRADSLGDEVAVARFRKEALALSRLNHPNICTIYAIGEAGGETFLAMEYVEGHSLRTFTSQALPADTVLRYGLALVEAVAHAHARGVVHRDLKTGNVIVTPEGRIKVLDFGLARRITRADSDAPTRSLLTAAGTVIGTLHYMAPEVLRGEEADERSDIWALGVMLYEMSAGRLPFTGQTEFELCGAILKDPPLKMPGSVAAAVQAVIARCLEKSAARRYGDCGELGAALVALQSGSFAVAGSFAVPAGSGVGRRSLVVLPLRNLSGDAGDEYFVDGTHEALITDLARLRGLRVIARPSSIRYRATEKTLREIAGELNVDTVLTGSVMRSGHRLRVTVQLVEPVSDEHLWAERYEREIVDVFSLQDEIVAAIARHVHAHLTPEFPAPHRSSLNPEAYEVYLKGRFHWHKQSPAELNTALEYFQLALQKDPHCALAYAGIADVWLARGDRGFYPPQEAFPKARTAAAKAIELDATLAEPHLALANLKFFGDWDWPGAEEEYRRAIQLNPNYVEAHLAFSHLLIGLRRNEEWSVEIQRALELDPLNFLVPTFYGSHLVYTGQFEEAIVQLRKVLEMQPGFSSAHLGLWSAYYKQGKLEEALAEARQFFKAINDAEAVASLDREARSSGYTGAMKAVADTLAARAERSHVPGIRIARIYAHAGETEQALKWLEHAYERHEGPLGQIGIARDWDGLRNDARFRDLLHRLKLPEN